MNSTLITYTGLYFDPLNPVKDNVSIEDIAHALSMNCRYNGHCSKFYSVAEHSVIVSRWVQDPIYGLLHDAAEAYISDLISPVKANVVGYHAMEERLLKVILSKYGLRKMPLDVKLIDISLRIDEMNQLITGGWQWGGKGLGVQIECWSPTKAKEEFLKCFNEYT